MKRVSQAQPKSRCSERIDPEPARERAPAEGPAQPARQRRVVGTEQVRHHGDGQRGGADPVAERHVPGDHETDDGAEHDAGGLPHRGQAADPPALGHRHAVRDGRGDGGVGRVRPGLDQAPEEQQRGDGSGPGQRQQARDAEDGPGQDPRRAPAQPGGGAVGERAEQRVGHQGDGGPAGGHEGEDGLLVPRVQRGGLQADQHVQWREERRVDADVDQDQAGDPAGAHAPDRFGQRLRDGRARARDARLSGRSPGAVHQMRLEISPAPAEATIATISAHVRGLVYLRSEFMVRLS